jgi:long-subunit fatty acid transport protein
MGTAVVNDATATYHNPAALTLVKNSQFIALGSVADFNSRFTGQSFSHINSALQSGESKTHANYYLPSIYLNIPIQDKLRIGIAVVSNQLNSDMDDTSILRYTTPNTQIQNIDFIPALGIQLNDYLSIGAGLTYSTAHFTSNPITGFPSLNIPDSQSHNVTSGTSFGGNAGFVVKPAASTLIGFNYRSALSYQFIGSSYYKGIPAITSGNYFFNFWTPARSVLTISHFITPDSGIIGTIQRVQWGIFDNVVIHGLATQVGTQSIILPQAVIPYHFHDTWTYTFGGIKNITPKWIIRVAGTYDQSPSNGHEQISNGDSMVLGASIGYEIHKNLSLDGSYAHVFIKNQPINIASRNNVITGINTGVGDSVSIKLTINS